MDTHATIVLAVVLLALCAPLDALFLREEPGQVDVRDKPPKQCGPICKMYCPYGFGIDRYGCRICRCAPPKYCGPMCLMYCRYGFVLDKYGCPICKCVPMPTCPGNSHIPVIPLQSCSPNDNECPASAHCPMQPHGVSICCTHV